MARLPGSLLPRVRRRERRLLFDLRLRLVRNRLQPAPQRAWQRRHSVLRLLRARRCRREEIAVRFQGRCLAVDARLVRVPDSRCVPNNQIKEAGHLRLDLVVATRAGLAPGAKGLARFQVARVPGPVRPDALGCCRHSRRSCRQRPSLESRCTHAGLRSGKGQWSTNARLKGSASFTRRGSDPVLGGEEPPRLPSRLPNHARLVK